MKWEEQGTVANARYMVVPRTLSFVVQGADVLLLRGAPDKRIWANKLNGVGGHLEPHEDPLSGARREVLEETGLAVDDLALRGVVHVAGVSPHPGVVLFVFVGTAPSRQTRPSAEGALEWHTIGAWPADELVADLPQLLPRVLRPAGAGMVYGHYALDPTSQRMTFRFS